MKSNDIGTIVVGVDLSDYSRCVVREAKELAQQLKAKLVYVYAIEGSEIYETAPSLFFEKLIEEQAGKVRKKYSLKGNQNLVVRLGHADRTILSVAEKEKNPLIVVGHKGGNAISRFFLGSVAEKLAASTPFPLWIHRGEETVLPKKIVIPSDLSKRSERTINEVKIFQRAFESDVEVFHVLQEPTPVMDFAAWTTMYASIKADDDRRLKIFRKKHPNLKMKLAQGTVVDSIQRHSKKFDLIAISPRRGVGAKTVFGSVTAKVVRSGDTPVLVVP